jgi:hypothetical protein
MTETPEDNAAGWDLSEWETALSIHVGTTYACRECGNLVMVTKGGVGVMDMVCCGKQMEKLASLQGAEGDGGGQ